MSLRLADGTRTLNYIIWLSSFRKAEIGKSSWTNGSAADDPQWVSDFYRLNLHLVLLIKL